MKAQAIFFGGLMLARLVSAAEGSFTVSTAVDYSIGKYGQSSRTETLYLPLGAKYETDNWTLRASVPYIESSGPSNVSGTGPDRVTINNGNTQRRHAAGLGDIIFAGSWNALQSGPWLLELGGRVKLATADEAKGLGTGKNDYSIQAELYRTLGKYSLFGSLGYKITGDPEGTKLRNPVFGSLGWAYRLSSGTSCGASYDYREKIQHNGAALSDATLFLTHRFDPHWKAQAYVSQGFTRASADFGGGLFIFYTY